MGEEGGEIKGACHTTHRAEFNQVRLVSWQVRASRAQEGEPSGLQEAAWLLRAPKQETRLSTATGRTMPRTRGHLRPLLSLHHSFLSDSLSPDSEPSSYTSTFYVVFSQSLNGYNFNRCLYPGILSSLRCALPFPWGRGTPGDAAMPQRRCGLD